MGALDLIFQGASLEELAAEFIDSEGAPQLSNPEQLDAIARKNLEDKDVGLASVEKDKRS